MIYPFIKMHGLGNDFVIFDGRFHSIFLAPEQVNTLADRRRGIGFDQLGIIHPPQHPEADVLIEIRNADGTTVGACGNLTRCVALLIAKEADRSTVEVETQAGVLHCTIGPDDTVSVNMGRPSYHWQDIPLIKATDTANVNFSIELLPPAVVVSIGNPHCIFIVENLEHFSIREIGPKITTHSLFPEGTNVELVQVLNRGHIAVAVWERGLGYSVACGSGACAAAVVAYQKGLVDSVLQVSMPGGNLTIQITPLTEIFMTGKVCHTFSGNIDLSLL